MFKRIVPIPKKPSESFFLWGPRQSGKSFLLRHLYPDVPLTNLLNTDEYAKFSTRPSLFREECLAYVEKHKNNKSHFFIIDEVQKVPALLDEVHLLIEDHGLNFCLCGSSARKLKRGHGNLLGGRAVRYELRGLVYPELSNDFDLVKILNRGYLPSHYLSDSYKKKCQSYVNEYLKEEIAAEGLVRNLPVFSDFLRSVAFSDTEIVNYTNIASDCGVSSPSVKEYFQILQDTLIGNLLPAYVRRPKRKVIHAPKFYFFDVALTNILVKRSNIVPATELWGKAFENWVHHEIRSYILYSESDHELTYWRLADSGREVDFIINDCQVAIEVKGKPRVGSDDLKALRELKIEQPQTGKRIIVSMETKRRLTDDGILILPYIDFVRGLWSKEWF